MTKKVNRLNLFGTLHCWGCRQRVEWKVWIEFHAAYGIIEPL